MTEHCEGHDSLVRSAGEATAAYLEHGKQLEKLFRLVESIKEVVDRNEVRAKTRDDKLDEINHKIENGLRSTIEETKNKVDALTICLERRKQLREAAEKKGFNAWLSRGIDGFKERSAYVVITAAIVGGVWFIIWIATKIQFFHEGPKWVLKIFGIG